MILEGVVVLVFGLPAGPTRRHDRVVHLRLQVFTDDDDFTPIHREGIGAVVQEHIIDKDVASPLRK
jgi:hypothetical protein